MAPHPPFARSYCARRPRAAALLPCLAAWFLLACPDRHSEHELLVRANAAAMQGERDQARRMYEDALRRNPDSPNTLTPYLGFLVAHGDLDTAAGVVARLVELQPEMGNVDRSRAQAEIRTYHDRRRDRAEGAMDPFPADRAAWEDAMVGILRIDRSGPELARWGEYLVRSVRDTLGVEDPTAELTPEEIDARVARLPPDDARRALHESTRSLFGDARVGFPAALPPEVEREVQHIRTAVARVVFDLDFDDAFAQRWQRRLESAGRWDRAEREFRIAYEGDWTNGLRPDSPPSLQLQQARTWYAREVATQLAYELSDLERDDAPPLPFDLKDFDRVEAHQLRVTDEGRFAFVVHIPWETVRRGAWLLKLRTDAAAERAP